MTRPIWVSVAACSLLLSANLLAQERGTRPDDSFMLPSPQSLDLSQAQPSGQATTPQAQATQQPATTTPSTAQQQSQSAASQSQAPTSGAEASAGFSPNMMGDQFGAFALKSIVVPTTITTTVFRRTQIPGDGVILLPITTQTQGTTRVTVQVPVGSLGAFKIAENESPRPVDRVFFTYNFYGDVTGAPTPPTTSTVNAIIGGLPATITTTVPSVVARVDVHRELFGFEKTFLGGNASIGMRAPLIEQQGGEFSTDNFGDLTIVSKFALWQDVPRGDVLSAGLVLTTPTGPKIETIDGSIHSTLFQPWTGFVVSDGLGFFVQGFSSLVIPTDNKDVILFFNDVGVGYKACRYGPDNLITSITPALEAHVTTPLNNRGATAPIRFPDLLVLTEGVHVGFYSRSTLSIGVAEPVTGPRPYTIEAFAQLNWRF